MSDERGLAQARMYLGANRPKEAIRVLELSLASNQDDAESLRVLAQAYLGAASGPTGAADALPAVQRSIELQPDNSHAWRILSVCYTRLGSHQQARDAARNARQLEPQQWLNHTAVAQADAIAHIVTSDTMSSVSEAIRLAPNQPEVHFAAGHVAQSNKQNDLAVQHYQRALALNPEHAASRNNLALIQMRRGNAGSAAAAFTSMLAQNPNSELALRNLRATGFSALRIVYFIIAIFVIIVNVTATSSGTSDLHVETIVIAIIAVGSVVGYVLWIRHRAGVYFGRFVRSVPATDKVLTVWAAILAVALVVLVAAIFLPPDAAFGAYTLTEYGLITTVIVISLIRRSRRA